MGGAGKLGKYAASVSCLQHTGQKDRREVFLRKYVYGMQSI